MKDKKSIPQWLGRPIASEDHANDLEMRAAMHEFSGKMPRSQAEQKAHDDYVKDHRLEASAHHLSGMRAAQATGNHEAAYKHWLMYDMHAKALGHESVGTVPPEIEAKLAEGNGQGKQYSFKAHKGDLYAFNEPKVQSTEPIAKAEAKQCKWKLGERRCQRKVSDGYCHHHKDHWANRIKQKEDSLTKANGASEYYHPAVPQDTTKPHLAPPKIAPVSVAPKQDTSLSHLKPPAVAPVAAKPALHSTVDGFMGDLRAMPKGPARGKFITQHVSHGPFLQALKEHPQGEQIHSTLMRHLNSRGNAGMVTGKTKVSVT